MARRWAHRVLLLASIVVASLVTRSASAAVPLCDERGASAIAPLPPLPVRDVRVDEAQRGSLCVEAAALLEMDAPSSDDGRSIARVDAVLEPATPVPPPWIPAAKETSRPDARTEGVLLAPRHGHARGVFHPPR